MTRAKKGGTIKVRAYAKRLLGGQGKSKRQIALASGYSPSVANSVKSHIENTGGFNEAMADLAQESGNMVMRIYYALQDKDLAKETVPVLLEAVRTMAGAWETFNKKPDKPLNESPLRALLAQKVKNQTINVTAK